MQLSSIISVSDNAITLPVFGQCHRFTLLSNKMYIPTHEKVWLQWSHSYKLKILGGLGEPNTQPAKATPVALIIHSCCFVNDPASPLIDGSVPLMSDTNLIKTLNMLLFRLTLPRHFWSEYEHPPQVSPPLLFYTSRSPAS